MNSANNHLDNKQAEQDRATMNSLKVLMTVLLGITAGLIIAVMLISN